MQLCVHVCVTVTEEHRVDSEPFLEILVTVNISGFFFPDLQHKSTPESRSTSRLAVFF